MPLVHSFDPPERFVTGTVGEPGHRTFFLQARAVDKVVTVSLEKQQVAVLVERLDRIEARGTPCRRELPALVQGRSLDRCCADAPPAANGPPPWKSR